MRRHYRFRRDPLVKSLCFAGFMLVAGTSSAASLPQQSYLPLEEALPAASAALKKCTSDGYHVSVSVVDRGGNLLAFVRHPLAGPHTVASSKGKAFTASSMGRPTAGLANMIADKPFLDGLRDMDQRLVILGGGLPVVIDDTHLGGIGVGGAPGGHLDEACAQAGLDAIGRNQ